METEEQFWGRMMGRSAALSTGEEQHDKVVAAVRLWRHLIERVLAGLLALHLHL